MKILCPYCGLHGIAEFISRGPAQVTRLTPEPSWAPPLFKSTRPKALHLEQWQHLLGCGRWFNVARDAKTQDIIRTYPLRAPPPEPSDR
jgi:sarcosine oxidase subunit delta